MTQNQYRVEKLGRKPSQVHEHQNWPNWAPRHAQVRAGLVVSWSGPGRIVAEALAVSQAQLPCRSVPAAHPARQRPAQCRVVGLAGHCVQRIVSRHNALPCLLSFNWLQSRYNVCIVTQPASPARSIAIHCNTHLASNCHNTQTVLRHTFCLAYLFSHNTLYCIVIQPAFT